MAAIYTSLSEQFVASRQPLISLSSTTGTSVYRDIITSTGVGTVTALLGELVVDSGATSGGSATITTVDTGFTTGIDGILCLIGVRISATPTGSEAGYWGYFDGLNGVGFSITATAPSIFSRKNGTDTIISQASWNTDKLDGTGGSSLTLDPTKVNIYKIEYNLSGSVIFSVVLAGAAGVSTSVVVHTLAQNTPVVANGNLPITVESLNGSTAASFKVYVGNREINILSHPALKPTSRMVGNLSGIITFPSGSFKSIVSIHKKSTGQFPNVNVYFNSIEFSVSTPLYCVLMTNASPPSPTWGPPNGYTAAETACEVDNTNIGTIGSGWVAQQFIVPAGYSNVQIHPGMGTIANNQIFFIMARGLTAAGSGVCNIKWTENW